MHMDILSKLRPLFKLDSDCKHLILKSIYITNILNQHQWQRL